MYIKSTGATCWSEARSKQSSNWGDTSEQHPQSVPSPACSTEASSSSPEQVWMTGNQQWPG